MKIKWAACCYKFVYTSCTVLLRILINIYLIFILIPNGYHYLYLFEPSLLHQIPSFSLCPSWGQLGTAGYQNWARKVKQMNSCSSPLGGSKRAETQHSPSLTSHLFRITSLFSFNRDFINRNRAVQVSTSASPGLDMQSFCSVTPISSNVHPN